MAVYKYCLGCGAEMDRADGSSSQQPPTLAESVDNNISTMQEALLSRDVFYPWKCPLCEADNDSADVRCTGCNVKRKEARAEANRRMARRPKPAPKAVYPDYVLGAPIFEGTRGELRPAIQTSVGRWVLVALVPEASAEYLLEHARTLAERTRRAAVALDIGTRKDSSRRYLAVDVAADAGASTFAEIIASLWSDAVDRDELTRVANEYQGFASKAAPELLDLIGK